PVVEERARGLAAGRVLGVALDRAAAQQRDLLQSARQPRGGDAGAPPLLVDEEARDPPVRLALELGEIRALVLDPRQPLGSAELAPAHAGLVVVHQLGVRSAGHHPRVLVGPVSLRRGLAPEALLVEAHAPAAAPDTAVALDARLEIGPRRLVQGPRAHTHMM